MNLNGIWGRLEKVEQAESANKISAKQQALFDRVDYLYKVQKGTNTPADDAKFPGLKEEQENRAARFWALWNAQELLTPEQEAASLRREYEIEEREWPKRAKAPSLLPLADSEHTHQLLQRLKLFRIAELEGADPGAVEAATMRLHNDMRLTGKYRPEIVLNEPGAIEYSDKPEPAKPEAPPTVTMTDRIGVFEPAPRPKKPKLSEQVEADQINEAMVRGQDVDRLAPYRGRPVEPWLEPEAEQ